ncbi:hypothetical protein H9P43_009271 [Blastocladiella emersonii ATCC 22665]|nr:hypothetical protein H9P43_009271 [Blastocladiella emersonii ATCC 22665]
MKRPGLGATGRRPQSQGKKARGGRNTANSRGGQTAMSAASNNVDANDATSVLNTLYPNADGLAQYAGGPDVDSNIHGLVSRLLERYEDVNEWNRAFAPLDHVDPQIWSNLMAAPTMDEFRPAAMVACAQGDTAALFILSTGIGIQELTCKLVGGMMSDYTAMAGTRTGLADYSNLGGMMLQAGHCMYSAILRERIAAVLREHKVLRGADALAAACATGSVADMVLRVVAKHALNPEASIWPWFNSSKPPAPHKLLRFAMQRVKLPPKFIDFYFNQLLPSIATQPAKPGCRVPINWVGEELWNMLYDVALCEILALADEVVAARGQV